MSDASADVRFRLANCRDAAALARVHYECSKAQPGAFVHGLGARFLVAYYHVILRNRSAVVLCAESTSGEIVGLVCGSTDAGEELRALRDHRYRLLAAALPKLICSPKLWASVALRCRAARSQQLGEGFVSGCGARISYWGWLPSRHVHGSAVKLLKAMLAILRELGVPAVRLEVDHVNRRAELVHKFLGATLIEEFITRDGRTRAVLEYQLSRSELHSRCALRN